MKILIDAQCFLWWFVEPDRLSAETIAAISDETNSIWFSVASVCELTIKVSLGTLSLPEPIDSYLASRMKKLRAQFLDIRADQVLKLATLPLDRFDLILLAIERINPKEATTDDIQTLGTIQLQLQRWIDGSYGKSINSPSTVKLDSPLMTIAMRGVSNNDDAAVFGTIMYAAAMRRAIAAASGKGSLLFIDEASITFDLDPLSLCVGRVAANGLKAGMRLMIAAQEPTSVYNSAGGKKIKDALSYHLIGRIGDSLAEYCNPELLGVPEALAVNNARKDFEPDKATCSSQWLLKIDDRFTPARIYLPPSLVALTANNIDEQQERKARAAATNGRIDELTLITH